MGAAWAVKEVVCLLTGAKRGTPAHPWEAWKSIALQKLPKIKRGVIK